MERPETYAGGGTVPFVVGGGAHSGRARRPVRRTPPHDAQNTIAVRPGRTEVVDDIVASPALTQEHLRSSRPVLQGGN